MPVNHWFVDKLFFLLLQCVYFKFLIQFKLWCWFINQMTIKWFFDFKKKFCLKIFTNVLIFFIQLPPFSVGVFKFSARAIEVFFEYHLFHIFHSALLMSKHEPSPNVAILLMRAARIDSIEVRVKGHEASFTILNRKLWPFLSQLRQWFPANNQS